MYTMRALLIIFLSIVSLSVHAQLDKEKAIKSKQEKKIADLLYAQGHYYSAIEYYKEVIRSNPEDQYTMYWLGRSFLHAGDYENAVKWIGQFIDYTPSSEKEAKRVEKEKKEVYDKAYFYYGQALKHTEQYEEAKAAFERFKSEYNNQDDHLHWKQLADIEIEGAQWAHETFYQRNKVRVSNMGSNVNSEYSESSPFPVGDSIIYFSSLQKNDLIFVDRKREIPPHHIYESAKVGTEWSDVSLLSEVINDEKYATGNAALSEDGNRLYFCKCDYNDIDEVICHIFLSQKTSEGAWSEPEQLNEQINMDNYTSTQPSVRSTGDMMDIVYFVSDRPEGMGGMDIWYFMRTVDGEYKGPKNIGKAVNTIADELTPYFDNTEEVLYFGSNGHPTMGGFDIFRTWENDHLEWRTPENIGRPVNSPSDDLYYVRQPGKTSGFIVSNREGTTRINDRYPGDDIFYFEPYKYGLQGLVFKEDTEGETLLDGATVRLYSSDLDGNEVLIAEQKNKEGFYFFELKPEKDYRLEATKPGYSSKVEYVSTKGLPDPDTLNQNISIDKTSLFAGGFAYDDTDTLKEAPLTDAIASLVELLPSGEERAMTIRRITDANKDFYFNLEAEKNYLVSVNKDGYFKKSISISTHGMGDVDTMHQDAFLTKIEVGKSYELENILYDFGKATLRTQSKAVLDYLVGILRDNPTMIIELGAHTDNIGSDEANMRLSQARAQSCVDYIIEQGISEERLIAKGYGESNPIAENTHPDGSDNPEGRQKNRRTEFMIVGGL